MHVLYVYMQPPLCITQLSSQSKVRQMFTFLELQLKWRGREFKRECLLSWEEEEEICDTRSESNYYRYFGWMDGETARRGLRSKMMDNMDEERKR